MTEFPIAPIPKPSAYELECEAQRAKPGNFARWLDANPVPDVQVLAEQYGGAGRIPQDVWQKFDERMANWRARYRLRAVGTATR